MTERYGLFYQPKTAISGEKTDIVSSFLYFHEEKTKRTKLHAVPKSHEITAIATEVSRFKPTLPLNIGTLAEISSINANIS